MKKFGKPFEAAPVARKDFPWAEVLDRWNRRYQDRRWTYSEPSRLRTAFHNMRRALMRPPIDPFFESLRLPLGPG